LVAHAANDNFSESKRLPEYHYFLPTPINPQLISALFGGHMPSSSEIKNGAR
jgi:hypothetical protein